MHDIMDAMKRLEDKLDKILMGARQWFSTEKEYVWKRVALLPLKEEIQ